MRRHWLPRVVVVTILGLLILTGCSWLGHGSSKTSQTSVFDVKPGECFQAPKEVKTELTDLPGTPCTKAHTQEAYAIVAYTAAAGSDPSVYPGDDLLTTFAQGTCAQRFQAYVGIDYLDSSLFFTYLLPSARGWEQDKDRNIICFVTTTGASLTSTVKGSKK